MSPFSDALNRFGDEVSRKLATASPDEIDSMMAEVEAFQRELAEYDKAIKQFEDDETKERKH